MYDDNLGPNAPLNEAKEVEVTVSITLSKTVKVRVDDYTSLGVVTDEDGNKYEDIDYSECDLKSAVKEQVKLPQDTCKGWDVDDFEVVLE